MNKMNGICVRRVNGEASVGGRAWVNVKYVKQYVIKLYGKENVWEGGNVREKNIPWVIPSFASFAVPHRKAMISTMKMRKMEMREMASAYG